MTWKHSYTRRMLEANRICARFLSNLCFQDNSGHMATTSLFLSSSAVHNGDQKISYPVRATRQKVQEEKNCCSPSGYYQRGNGFFCV